MKTYVNTCAVASYSRDKPLSEDDEDSLTEDARMENLQSKSYMLDTELDEHGSRQSFKKATFPPPENHNRSRAIQHNNITKQSKIREVPGYIGGHEVSAFPDSGSSYNLISKSLASEIGADINLSDRRSVPLPSGYTQTLGTVTLPFEFHDERQPYTLVFHVMKRCFQGCILGEEFLRKTETLGNHLARRVRQKLVSFSQLLRFNLVDNPHERLMGTLNGQFIGALADTGASINVMARSTAEHLGLRISQRKHHTTRLAFVDGSIASTSGTVFDVEWKFGSDSTRPGHLLDFHILDELPCDVVLGEDVLYENDAFSRYRDCFYNNASSKYGKETIDFLGLIINFGREGNPAFSIINEEVLQELHRRSTAADEIAELPFSEQPAARAAEERRREEWNRNRLIGTAGNAATTSTDPQITQPSMSSNGTGTSQAPAPPIPPPRRRFRIFSLRRFSIVRCPASSSPEIQLPYVPLASPWSLILEMKHSAILTSWNCTVEGHVC